MSKFNLVVRENSTLMTEVLKNYFTSKLEKRSIFSLYQSNMDTLPNILNNKPFFNNGLLLIVYTEKMSIENLKTVIKLTKDNENFSIIYFSDKSSTFDYLSQEIDKNLKTLNFYKPPDWLLMEYIKYTSPKKFTTMAIQTMYKRLKGQWKYIDNYIQEINSLSVDLITDEEVTKIIPIFKNLNLDSIFESIILNTLSRADVRTLYEYKYASSFLLKEMEKRINILIKLKIDYVNGLLSFKNIENYYLDNKDKLHISEFTLRKYMKTLLTQLPTFYLYKWKHIILSYRKMKDGFILMLLETGVLK